MLGVDEKASSGEIRKAYLKQSLRWHPDKNPGEDVEEAKRKFVEIGQAYETLKDPALRAKYDRELRGGGGFAGGFGNGFGGGGGASYASSSPFSNDGNSAPFSGNDNSAHQYQQQYQQQQSYDNYRDFFDATVAGMSEEELRACLGGAALIGSIVGGIVGKKLLGGGGGRGNGCSRSAAGAGSTILSTVGSIAGSAVASRMAQDAVLSLHETSRQRLQWKEDCRRAVERGEVPPPDPTRQNRNNNWGEKLRTAVESATQQQSADRGSGNGPSGENSFWKQAKRGARAVAEAARQAAEAEAAAAGRRNMNGGASTRRY